MIPTRELDRIREDAKSYLQSVCDIARRASVSDGGGSFEDSWSIYARKVPCRLSATSGPRGESAGRVPADGAHRFWIPVDQPVRLSDHIYHEGRKWEITNLPRRTEFDHFVQQVDVVEIDRKN